MTRLLIRYLLSLFFLFWGGYAHLHHHRCCYGSNKIYQDTIQTGLSASSNRRMCFSKAPPANNASEIFFGIKDTLIEEEEEEEEETKPSRNHSETSHYTAFFNTRSNGAIGHSLSDRLPFCEHFSYFSPDKFIIHRMIRV